MAASQAAKTGSNPVGDARKLLHLFGWSKIPSPWKAVALQGEGILFYLPPAPVFEVEPLLAPSGHYRFHGTAVAARGGAKAAPRRGQLTRTAP